MTDPKESAATAYTNAIMGPVYGLFRAANPEPVYQATPVAPPNPPISTTVVQKPFVNTYTPDTYTPLSSSTYTPYTSSSYSTTPPTSYAWSTNYSPL